MGTITVNLWDYPGFVIPPEKLQALNKYMGTSLKTGPCLGPRNSAAPL